MKTSKYVLIKNKDRSVYTYHCINYFDVLLTMWLEIMKEKNENWLHMVERKHNYRKLRGEANDYVVEFRIERVLNEK